MDLLPLKGFRDALPVEEEARQQLLAALSQSFSLHGFTAFDTPCLEKSDVLFSKEGGETSKQVYRFEDSGGRDVGLRFDLTIPLARFVCAHQNELSFPFFGYHIAKVWRGERPQKGRFREFYQADFDILGSSSALSDWLALDNVISALRSVGLSAFQVHVSSRALWGVVFQSSADKALEAPALRLIDKAPKITTQDFNSALLELGLSSEAEEKVRALLTPSLTLKQAGALLGEKGAEAIQRLEQVFSLASSAGLERFLVFDSSIARGLDYYTGMVFETFLSDYPTVGSVSSGGRYDELTSLFDPKLSMGGVGGSIGVDRLLASGALTQHARSRQVLIVSFNGEQSLAATLSQRLFNVGISCLVYPQSDKMARQLRYAEKEGFALAILCGEEERKAGTALVKELNLRVQHSVALEELPGVVLSLLEAAQ